MAAKKYFGFIPVLIIALFLLPLLGGCNKNEATSAEDQAKARQIPVSLQPVQRGPIANVITISGKVTAGAEINVVPKYAGKVVRTLVEVGSEVKSGQPLVELDTSDLEWRLREAQADLEAARLDLAAADPQVEVQRANLKRFESELVLQQANLSRQQQLYEAGAVSKQILETQENAVVAAQTGVEATDQQIRALEAATELKRTIIDRREASVNSLLDQIAAMTVTAPVAGKVAAKHVEPGEAASPAAPVVTLVDTAKMYLEASLSEREITLVSPGQKVQVVVDALGDNFTVEGKVSNIGPAADAKTKAFLVRFQLDDQAGKLRPGMFGKVLLVTGEKSDALVVPKEAVVERNGQKVAFTVGEGKAVLRPVNLGLNDEKMVEVTTGLTDGDQIVVTGQQNLQEGNLVNVVDQPSDTGGK
ncbi:MAG: efflux RND transporter periplasmic adaptor subunit [Heliobacteriaceae bacterium]|nr:efflux RND transporter periplasmic adaptor subunit [Heliobacteriaceae bacterium]MDD4588363.1 efflux RND transporter periplasmic adaptor subunit [Heliobacteriaceae bacterium]